MNSDLTLNPDSYWFLQERDWGIGDFVLATPALKSLSLLWNRPVPVFFDDTYVEQAFRSCPFIRILESRPDTEPFGDNKYQRSLLRSRDDCEDVAHHKVIVGLAHPLSPTYADPCDGVPFPVRISELGPLPPVAFFLGCNHTRYVEAKRIEPSLMAALIEETVTQGYGRPILLGSASDLNLYWEAILPLVAHLGVINLIGRITLRETLKVVNTCIAYVSNDTGLYHCANALGKRGLVIWGDTPAKWNSPNYSKAYPVRRTEPREVVISTLGRIMKHAKKSN